MSISIELIEKEIREAGAIAMDYFANLGDLEISKKSPRDLVTEADVAVESFLHKKLQLHYPRFGFWGEESGQSENQSQRWVVDPIDGTHSFSKGQYFWGISVALEIEGDIVFGAVFAPALDDYYMAQKGQGAWKNNQLINVSSEETLANAMITTGFACLRDYREDNNLDRFCRVARATTGQRRFGSAALDLCLVADGQVDAFWEQALNLYDIAAGALIAQEAGGSVTDFNGNPGVFPEQILVTNNKVLDQLLPLM